jgi:predicted RNase H-like HicB family nuclease
VEEEMSHYTVPVIVEKDEGGYFANCPALQGCFTQGDTYEEVLANMKDAIELHIQDRLACGEEINLSKSVSVTALGVAA